METEEAKAETKEAEEGNGDAKEKDAAMEEEPGARSWCPEDPRRAVISTRV